MYDGLSSVEMAFITVMPFILGRRVLRTSQSGDDILSIMVIAGLIYSLPMLFEIRFSPQLHFWIYGFYSSRLRSGYAGRRLSPNGLHGAWIGGQLLHDVNRRCSGCNVANSLKAVWIQRRSDYLLSKHSLDIV